MVIILVLLTFVIFIALSGILESRKKLAKVLIHQPISQQMEISTAMKFLHPGHSWFYIDQSKLACIGIDDFTKQLMGKIDKIELPEESTFIHQGDPLVTLKYGKRSITIVSPLSGILKEVNHPLQYQPNWVQHSVEIDGWITKILPINLTREIKNLIHGKIEHIWNESLRHRLLQLFTPKVGPVLQDGGKIVENFADTLTDEEWDKILDEFFPINFEIKNNL